MAKTLRLHSPQLVLVLGIFKPITIQYGHEVGRKIVLLPNDSSLRPTSCPYDSAYFHPASAMVVTIWLTRSRVCWVAAGSRPICCKMVTASVIVAS